MGKPYPNGVGVGFPYLNPQNGESLRDNVTGYRGDVTNGDVTSYDVSGSSTAAVAQAVSI